MLLLTMGQCCRRHFRAMTQWPRFIRYGYRWVVELESHVPFYCEEFKGRASLTNMFLLRGWQLLFAGATWRRWTRFVVGFFGRNFVSSQRNLWASHHWGTRPGRSAGRTIFWNPKQVYAAFGCSSPLGLYWYENKVCNSTVCIAQAPSATRKWRKKTWVLTSILSWPLIGYQ